MQASTFPSQEHMTVCFTYTTLSPSAYVQSWKDVATYNFSCLVKQTSSFPTNCHKIRNVPLTHCLWHKQDANLMLINRILVRNTTAAEWMHLSTSRAVQSVQHQDSLHEVSRVCTFLKQSPVVAGEGDGSWAWSWRHKGEVRLLSLKLCWSKEEEVVHHSQGPSNLSAQTPDGWGSRYKASSSEDLDPEAHNIQWPQEYGPHQWMNDHQLQHKVEHLHIPHIPITLINNLNQLDLMSITHLQLTLRYLALMQRLHFKSCTHSVIQPHCCIT